MTDDADGRGRPHPGGPTLAAAAILYALAVAGATWPYATEIADRLPTGGDPPQHLWIMRWYKSCLLDGRSPLVCPELQYPVGAPLGNFSPLHVQSLLYLPLSALVRSDPLCYNLISLFGLVTTGLGTLLLTHRLTGSRPASALAGLLAILAAPVMLHAHSHLELHFLGAFPLFLLAWLRFLEEPTRRRLAAAAGSYLLLVACAAYFAVMAIAPAVFAVAWQMVRAGRSGLRGWIRSRLGWLFGFAAAVGPGLALLLAGQLWAMAHGGSMDRPFAEFADHGSPWWSYGTPMFLHRLHRQLPADPYLAAGYVGIRGGLLVDNASYLGVVTLGLLAYALVRRVRFPHAGFWWGVFALLVVLSLGAYLELGPRKVGLPALWLWRNVPAFRMLRSPARFNLFAVVVAAVLAGAGLADLLRRLRHRPARLALTGLLAAVAVWDLGLTPYLTWTLEPPPACYAFLKQHDPGATLLELPLQSSGFDTTDLDRTYWQSVHGLPTSAGYSGIVNAEFDRMIFWDGPFPSWRPDFLQQPDAEHFGLAAGVSFRDYAWLFLHAHGYKYVVLHRPRHPGSDDAALRGRIEAALSEAKLYEDDRAIVYARDRLPAPTAPVFVCLDGWRTSLGHPGPIRYGASRHARLVAYNPDPATPLVLALDAVAPGGPRTVRLQADGNELARWTITPGDPRLYATPPLSLPSGMHALILTTDGEFRPRRSREAIDRAGRPYSLRIAALGLKPAALTTAPPPTRR